MSLSSCRRVQSRHVSGVGDELVDGGEKAGQGASELRGEVLYM
jgi:hypothetical protein